MPTHTLALFGQLGGWEILLLGLLGLLIFGKRLPEVGKSLGKGIVEFKKGLQGVEDDIDKAAREEESKKQLEEPAAYDSLDSEVEHEPVEAEHKTQT